MIYHRRTTCRICGATRLSPFLDLSPMPLANAFLKAGEDVSRELTFPLLVCLCESCGLVQIPDVIAPEVLFREYIYLSGTSDTMAAHHRASALAVVQRLGLGPQDRVVEIASNDGSLLRYFQDAGVRTLGVEPALNLAARSRQRGIETVARFFDRELAADLARERGLSRAVLANNVLAHVDHPVDFLVGCRMLLAPEGHIVVEVPWLGDLLEHLEYDTIYHEHLSYFSATALLTLFAAADLAVERIEHIPVHGGSMRVWAVPRKPGTTHADGTLAWVDGEKQAGLTDLERWKHFATDVTTNRRTLLELLSSLKKQGARVAAYGAPAKGNTLLNWCRIGVELVEFTVDRNPLKVGSLTPGMHIPVLSVDTLAARRPDYVLVLAWNLLDEILDQQRELRKTGTRFVRPIPSPEVVA